MKSDGLTFNTPQLGCIYFSLCQTIQCCNLLCMWPYLSPIDAQNVCLVLYLNSVTNRPIDQPVNDARLVSFKFYFQQTQGTCNLLTVKPILIFIFFASVVLNDISDVGIWWEWSCTSWNQRPLGKAGNWLQHWSNRASVGKTLMAKGNTWLLMVGIATV